MLWHVLVVVLLPQFAYQGAIVPARSISKEMVFLCLTNFIRLWTC
jgi:hypothetical protein